MRPRGATPAPAPSPDTFFDLSFAGALPKILRQLADRIESRDCEAAEFTWRLNKERLEFTASIDMRPK